MPTTSVNRADSLPTNMSTRSSTNRRQSALKSFSFRQRSDVEVVVGDDHDFVPTFSTFDEIKGHVNICFDKDTTINDVNICFEGQTNTWVEKMAAVSPRTGRATAKHTFLRMSQPIETTPFSADNVAKAGVTYTIPFVFVVPEQILPFVCSHPVDNDRVKAQHLLMPPSIGDEMLAGEGSMLMDDLAPAMSKIIYTIRARVSKNTLANRSADVKEGSTRVRIIPARHESPPMLARPNREQCTRYELRKEKNVRKGILGIGKKQGRLVAETTQPRSLRLPHPKSAEKKPVTTMTVVNLRYDPNTAEDQPPPLSNIVTKLKAYTFFGAQPFKYVPDADNHEIWSVVHGHYSISIDISTMNLGSIQWKRHDPNDHASATTSRRESVARATSIRSVTRNLSTSTGSGSVANSPQLDRSGLRRVPSNLSDSSHDSNSTGTSITTCSSPSSPTSAANMFSEPNPIAPSTTYNEKLPYYTTSILVPITLPSSGSSSSANTSGDAEVGGSGDTQTDSQSYTPHLPGLRRGAPTFLPTFHSCLVSRTYALDISVGVAGPGAPNLGLRSPVEIVSELARRNASAAANANSAQMTGSIPSPPSAWYDPFTSTTIPNHTQTNGLDVDESDFANDEAIARALVSQYPTHYMPAASLSSSATTTTTNNTANDTKQPQPEAHTEQIPSYADSQQTAATTRPFLFTPSRPALTPVPASIPTSTLTDAPPPEYYSSFRRATFATLPSTSTSASAPRATTPTSPSSPTSTRNPSISIPTSTSTSTQSQDGNENSIGPSARRQSTGLADASTDSTTTGSSTSRRFSAMGRKLKSGLRV